MTDRSDVTSERDRWRAYFEQADKELHAALLRANAAEAEVNRLCGVLARIAAGHAHPSKLAGEALDASDITAPPADQPGGSGS